MLMYKELRDFDHPEPGPAGRAGQAFGAAGLALSIVLAAVVVLSVIGPASAGTRCAAATAAKDYSIDVRVEFPQIRLDRSRSRAELSKMAAQGRGAKQLGLMVSELEIRNFANFQAVEFGDKYCFWVDEIEVDLTYTALDVYVAKEYRPPSCAYRVILEHEKKHVAVLREHAERYSPDVRKALTSLLIPDPDHPALVESTDAAEQEIEALFQELLAPIFEKMQVSIDQAQASLDSPQSYRLVYDRCNDW